MAEPTVVPTEAPPHHMHAAADGDRTITPAEYEAAAAPVTPVSRWAIHRRLYDWVLSFAHHKHSTLALAILAFAESSFFPIPPDVLLMPLAMGNRKKAWWFAAVCTLASVAGGVLGYYIGAVLWTELQGYLYRYVPGFTPAEFARVEGLYKSWGILILFAAAFTPIPFKVFTIAGGVMNQALLPFIAVAAVGRGMRFFLVAGLMWMYGEKIVPFIDKYFNLLCVAFTILLIGGVAAIKLLH